MYIDFLKERFLVNKEKTAFIYFGESYSYNRLMDDIAGWKDIIYENRLPVGSNVIIDSSYTPYSVSLLLALIELGFISVPFPPSLQNKKEEYYLIAEPDFEFKVANDGNFNITPFQRNHYNPLFEQLKKEQKPGLILFSSGTAGKSKGVLHDFTKLLQKYKKQRKDYTTLAFMLYDHIGGIDTLFYSLSNTSTIVLTESRMPREICRLIERHRVEVLPVTPTFLNLLLLSEQYKKFDLSSLKYITYGTEPIPDYTLKKITEIFPDVNLLQKFGTTEVGTLRSKSKSTDSPWVKIGGEGYETRIVDGILQIKADSAMIGYLNEKSPFTEDGWFITGDEVETDGEYYRILGRKTEIINVGGEKVYPSEVENTIMEIDDVSDCKVYGETNQIMGNIVCADVFPVKKELDKKELKKRIKKYCSRRLEAFKVPVKIRFTMEPFYTERFKKKRQNK